MEALSREQRIASLESMEQIRALKAVYCDLCDRGYDPGGLSALFMGDTLWDGIHWDAMKGGKPSKISSKAYRALWFLQRIW